MDKERAISMMKKHVGTYAQVYAKFLYRTESDVKVYSFFAVSYDPYKEVVEVEDLNPYIAAILGTPIKQLRNKGDGIVVQFDDGQEIIRLLGEAVYGRDTLKHNVL